MSAQDFVPNPDLVAEYLNWARESVINLRDYFTVFSNNSGPDQENFDAIYGLVHNLKGLGSSFGYELMTSVGQSLCVYMRTNDKDTVEIKSLDAHIRAFEVILENEIQGDGGDKGEALMKRLHDLTAYQQ